jgi:hypothetical protein
MRLGGYPALPQIVYGQRAVMPSGEPTEPDEPEPVHQMPSQTEPPLSGRRAKDKLRKRRET